MTLCGGICANWNLFRETEKPFFLHPPASIIEVALYSAVLYTVYYTLYTGVSKVAAPCRTNCTFDVLVSQSFIQRRPLAYHQHLSHSEVIEGTQRATSFLQNNTPTYIVHRPWAIQTLSYGAEFTIGIANCKCFAISDPMQGVSLHLTRMVGGGRQKIAE